MLAISIIWILSMVLKIAVHAEVPEIDSISDASITNNLKNLKELEKELEARVKSAIKSVLPFFVRNSNANVSFSCMSTLMKIFMDLRNLKLPVVKMLDAMAKPPSGILKGGLNFMGNYDECLEVTVDKRGNVALEKSEEVFHGQYCMLEAEIPKALVASHINYRYGKMVNISALGKLGQFIAELPIGRFDIIGFKIGMCMPSTCSAGDLKELIALVPFVSSTLSVKYCDDGRIQQLNVGQVIFISFIVLFGSFVILGTLVEMCKSKMSNNKEQIKNKWIQLFLAFSIYSNTKKLMKADNSHSTRQISVISGMYVVGSLFVIAYHTYFMPFMAAFLSNSAYFAKSLNDWKFTIMSTMGISIDAYFLFSGIFMTYPYFRGEGKQINVNIFKIIIRRYFRFGPSMLVILGAIISLPLIGSGPVWADIFGVAAENARKWWWTYVLMFNNFLAYKDQSFFPLWFIPCLMQITVIGVILLWFMSKNLKFGIFLTIAISLSCSIALGVLTYLRNYPLTYAMYYYYQRDHMETAIYTSPLSHVPPYGIGILLGYFMAKNPVLKWKKIFVVVGWISSLSLIFGTHLFCYIGNEGQDLDPVLTTIYAATHRILYCIGISWIVLACTYGYGGVLAEFLLWKGFGVLAKLSYSGYLIHYIVIAYHVSFTRVPLSFSHYETMVRFCGYVVISILASYIFYTTFELPMRHIESLLFPKRSSEKNEICVNGNASKKGDTVNSNIPPMLELSKV